MALMAQDAAAADHHHAARSSWPGTSVPAGRAGRRVDQASQVDAECAHRSLPGVWNPCGGRALAPDRKASGVVPRARAESDTARATASSCATGVGDSIRRNVLVEPEKVVRVVLALEPFQAVVLGRAIGLADPILPFLHEEVDVDMLMVGLQCGP
jgi:hypothetical protein